MNNSTKLKIAKAAAIRGYISQKESTIPHLILKKNRVNVENKIKSGIEKDISTMIQFTSLLIKK